MPGKDPQYTRANKMNKGASERERSGVRSMLQSSTKDGFSRSCKDGFFRPWPNKNVFLRYDWLE